MGYKYGLRVYTYLLGILGMSDFNIGAINDYLVGCPVFAGNQALAYYRITRGHANMSTFSSLTFDEFKAQAQAINLAIIDDATSGEGSTMPPDSLERAVIYAQMIEQGGWFNTFDELQAYLNA
jgi:hypothetical protein